MYLVFTLFNILHFFYLQKGVPGPPTDLQFSEITMNSLKVSWTPPKRKNGLLLGYIITYETAEQNERKTYFLL